MNLKLPESMAELVYWTSRKIGNGNVKAWVYREDCPKCKKEKMGKPVVKGKVKVRAKEYICPSCKYTIDKQEYEDSLQANIIYECPHCNHKGDISIPFKRKKYKGVNSLVFSCGKCGEKIAITKKLKKIKKK